MDAKKIQFSTLDSLRGFAAVSVAIYHFYGNWGGYLALDFFLVLSGFILSHNYLYNRTETDKVEFISHRLARLYPLHIFTLLTFIAVYFGIFDRIPSYTDGTLFTFIQQITLTQNIGLNPSQITWNFPNWSISVELWVNILFIFFVTKETKNITLFILALIGLLIIYNNTGHLDTTYKNYYGFLNSGMTRGLSSFFLGILSYRIYLYYENHNRIKRRINLWEISCLIGVLAIVFGRPEKYSGLDVFAPFLFMFLVCAFAFEDGFLSKFLKNFNYLGKISYSIYLNQVTIFLAYTYALHKFDIPYQYATAGLTTFVTVVTAYLLLLIAYSHFTYKYIEKPLRNRGRNILSYLISRN